MQALAGAGLPATPEAAARFLQYVNASPTPFHAVHNAALRLESAGFKKVAIAYCTRDTCSAVLTNLIDQREGRLGG